jgi:hypothetical protein
MKFQSNEGAWEVFHFYFRAWPSVTRPVDRIFNAKI